MTPRRSVPVACFLLVLIACSRESSTPAMKSAQVPRPDILLVTLDTTRADSIGPDVADVETPVFDALARSGRRFRQAYATVPQTLPSHASMLTGLYPAAHGVHENARHLDGSQTLAAERLKDAGYYTAAFVSSFSLARRFGLARGFEIYDDTLPEDRSERSALETTERALAFLQHQSKGKPLFLWVHYYDPHAPYEPPEPFRSRHPDRPYLGEIEAMDEQMGRLVDAFQSRSGGSGSIVVVGDHGEGLGDHGESEHGNLVYQSVMHVPLLMKGPGVPSGVTDEPVSTRRVFDTILDWAGLPAVNSLRADRPEVVLGEGMIPFLQYGWQPQVMAVEGRQKVINAGKIEVYDVIADPQEKHDLAGQATLSRAMREAIREYPIPSPEAAPKPETLDEEARRRLASLGYIASEVRPVIRKDAPRPIDMAPLFGDLDRASDFFVAGNYSAASPLLEKVLAEDPHNLMAALRLAAAQSALGHDARALSAFRKAEAIAPKSMDVRTYLALHYLHTGEIAKAEPMLEQVLAAEPDRLTAIEGLATIRERQGRLDDAVALLEKARTMKSPTAAELVHLGELAMRIGNTSAAIEAFEGARAIEGTQFRHDLELGVLYLADRRFAEARAALDRVGSDDPGYPMALFKRAQVSVLLGEPDHAARIAAARQHANATTRELIEKERLFQDAGTP